MKTNYFLAILLVLLALPQFSIAQAKKPKVVLVLSGGGAKGVAHTPLLQALDSLHIVPDLIVGNSMGSVIGGLYAMGYSGDSIAKFISEVNWSEILGGKVTLKDVSVEEKSEYERYQITLNISKGKPLMKNYILNDQNLREYLSTLTYPVYNVTDFDKLSIPFRALATDAVNGEEVVLRSGSLETAIRASMSIPGVFKPVPYKNTLLVDGGVLDNFPTDIAKKMGADIIIGSDVGGGMVPKDSLNSIPTMLTQLSMFTSNMKNDANRALCDILVDHLPNLKYSTADFDKSNDLYEEGKIATKKNLPALIALADKLKNFKQIEHKLPNIENKFTIDSVIYRGISPGNIDLVTARANFKLHEKYTTQEIVKGIDRAMGTGLFSEISYELSIVDENKTAVILNVTENAPNQAKASLHFDSDRGFGVILNYTGRNILGDASRFTATGDFAQQPRIRIEYQKIFGKQKNWWWNAEAYGEHLIQELFLEGKRVDDIIDNSIQYNNQINKNLNSLSSYFGLGIYYQYTRLTPKTDPIYNALSLVKYKFNNIELDFHFSYNDMNDVFFARKGDKLYARLSRSILHNASVDFYDSKEFEDASGKTNGFTKLSANYERRIPFNKNVTGIIEANINYIFEDKLKESELSFSRYGYGEKYLIGGILPIPGRNNYRFPGLNQNQLAVTQFTELHLASQIKAIKKVFITPHLNMASAGFDSFNNYINTIFSPKGKWQNAKEPSFLLAAGAIVSYDSLLGPINFDTSYINGINNVKLFFSIGLTFNVSK